MQWSGLIWFYAISTIVGYLKPNPFYTYVINISFWNSFFDNIFKRARVYFAQSAGAIEYTECTSAEG